MCDVMALALHRLTGLPYAIIYVVRPDPDGDEDDEELIPGHAVVTVGDGYLDVTGYHHELPRPEQMVVDAVHDTDEVRIYAVGEEDIRTSFTTMDIDDDEIEMAMDFARSVPKLSRYIEGYHGTAA